LDNWCERLLIQPAGAEHSANGDDPAAVLGSRTASHLLCLTENVIRFSGGVAERQVGVPFCDFFLLRSAASGRYLNCPGLGFCSLRRRRQCDANGFLLAHHFIAEQRGAPTRSSHQTHRKQMKKKTMEEPPPLFFRNGLF